MVDINWGLMGQQVNPLLMYQQGRQDRQRNDLLQAREAREVETQAYNRQRNATLDARADEKWRLEKKGMEQEQLLSNLKGTYDVIKNLTTPEAFAAAQRDPNILALAPDIAEHDFATVQGLRESLSGLFEKPKAYQGANLGDGGYGAFDPTTGQLSILREPNPKPLEIDPTKDLYLPSSAGASGVSGGQGRATGQFESFYRDYLAPAEGGYAANDGNGKPVNFGINQGANPDIDVSKLTPEQAAKITYERYWKPSGADQLPPGLAEVHADTAFNMGIEPAKRLLEESGGDVGRYFQLRENRYRSIAQNDPGKGRFLNTWLDRNERLRQYVGGGSGGQGQSVGGFTLARPGRHKPEGGVRRMTPDEARAQGLDPTGVYQMDEKGRVTTVDKTTDGEKQTAAFAYRTLQANDRMNALADRGVFKPSTATESLFNTDKSGALRIVARNAQDRQFIQASKEWLAPILRKDTGAAVTDSELATYMDIFIPRFEDDVQTIRQKAQARQDAMKALVGQAGRAYGAYPSRQYNVRMPALPGGGRPAASSGQPYKARNGATVTER